MKRSAPIAGTTKLSREKNAVRQIVARARHHFMSHGFRGVTMDDLAEELGMSKRTLYAHFPSKRALLESVITDKLRSVEAGLKGVMGERAPDFPARLHAMLACMREQADEIQPAFIRDVRREVPELFALVQDGRRKLIQRHFGTLLRNGRKAGSIRRDIPVELMIEILIGAVDAIINPARMGELGLTPKTGFAQITSVFLEGALVRSGGRKR
ncbi:MAG: TetR/AcrR family transcriptional regulator [Chthoniobacteraceae bacterium]